MNKELEKKDATAGSSRAECDRSAAARREPGTGQQPGDQARALDELGVIVVNEWDRRTLAWLVQKAGPEAVADAVRRLPGARRPYARNVACVLGLVPPKVLALAPADSPARQALAAKIAALRGKTCNTGLQAGSVPGCGNQQCNPGLQGGPHRETN